MDNQTPASRKLTKEQVDYKLSASPAEHRCGICEYHLHVLGTKRLECGIVEGSIDPMYGCKLFSIDLIASATDKITLLSNPPAKRFEQS